MRRRRKAENHFIGLTLNSSGVLVGIVGLMLFFARTFGELAIPAINVMANLMYIPITTLVIGVFGWVYSQIFDS